MKHFFSATLLALALSASAAAPVQLELKAGKPGAQVQPTMYGLFFEDINYGADGGLYAEMIKNRSFEFPQALTGWTASGKVVVEDQGGPFERNPRYVRLLPAGHRSKYTVLENEGYFGVSFHKGEEYRFSVYARAVEAGKPAVLRVELVDPSTKGENMIMAQENIIVPSTRWAKYTVFLTPSESAAKGKGRLRIFLDKHAENAVDLEHISLFPVNTFNGHENGLRADIAQALADVHPGIFRFPGGCIVEGTEVPDRYQWKNTVGRVENRPTNINRWQFEFPYRFSSDYYQSYGLGFYEYFQLAEEMGAEPLPVLNVGMVCQYENPDPKAHVPVDSLDEYIQDAIDLVEFANGDTTTVWGALRAEMGHPAPFNLKYLAIGNEQWGPEYVERLEPFVNAFRKACPEIKIVGSSGPSADGEQFDYLWPEMRRLGADLVDEHYYQSEDWFKNNAARYDSYDRKGPKVFAGEYACHTRGRKYNNFDASLMEAAFMTGLERNADIVHMATYAPLLAHEEGWQWRPDMIWFDNDTVRLTSSYFVQQLYATNRGDRVVPLLNAEGKPMTGQDGLYASAVTDGNGGYIIKIANIGKEPQPFDIRISGAPRKAVLGAMTITEFSAPADRNSNYYSADDLRVTEVDFTDSGLALPVKDSPVNLTVPAETFAVIHLTLKSK